MLRDWKLRIEDILEAISKIFRYTEGMDYERFAADELRVDAVLRNFTVIGEATRHIPDEITSKYPEVPWDKMRGMRNIVVHEYFGVSLRIIWDTIQEDLPPLVPLLEKILEGK